MLGILILTKPHIMPERLVVDRALLPQSLILFHGLGSDGADMQGLAQAIPWHGRLICPDAEPRAVTINGGYVMRAWFDILGLTPEDPVDEAGIRAAVEQARRLIETERAAGVPAERIVIGGFSQGGVVALHAALRYPHRLGGVLALSTWLPLRQSLAAEHQPAALATPIFIAHGTADDIVPLRSAQRAEEALLQLGCQTLSFHTYPMGHSIANEELSDLRAWLSRQLT